MCIEELGVDREWVFYFSEFLAKLGHLMPCYQTRFFMNRRIFTSG